MANKVRSKRIRWGDRDKYFGPFTYSKDNSYKPYAIVLGSGDDEDRQGCRLRLSGLGHTLILALPQLIKPWRKKVVPGWDKKTIQRLGRDWYWDTHEREYGFSYSDGFLNVPLGRQTHDSSTEQCWSMFLPWTQWRHVRRSLYGLKGEHYWDEPKGGYRLGLETYQKNQGIINACPSQKFSFRDYDGELLTARTRIEEREWKFGEGSFKWLSIFCRPKISRSLDIKFSGETGKRKGSWKGGTLGHSITLLPDELHEAAFRRYCTEHNMTFINDESHG